jgi:diguanylate cyclase (GGDEF)-like protein/PAS domain S-box-containing protein
LPGVVKREAKPDGTVLNRVEGVAIDELILPFRHSDGTVHYLQVEQYVLRDETGTPTHVEGVAQDVTERVRAEQLLATSEARYRELFEQTSDLIQAVDRDGKFVYVNSAWKATLGYDDGDLVHLSVFDLIHPDDQVVCREKFPQMLRGAVIDPVRVRFVRKDGGVVVLEGNLRCNRSEDDPIAAQGIFRDITQQVQAEQRLQHAATHDKLTNLPNRTLFFDRLTQALKIAERQEECLAVLFVDLDGFKDVNDTYGHHIGDQLLVAFTQRLRDALRKSDTAARLSGDEFALIFENIRSPQDTEIIAKKILTACSPPYAIQEYEVIITLSIGISLYPDDGDTADALLQRADAAMYRVKQEGKNNYAFFSALKTKDVVQGS